MTDEDEMTRLARGLVTPELDSTSAARIAEIAKREVGRGLPKRRLIEAILVGGLVSATLIWAVLNVVEMVR